MKFRAIWDQGFPWVAKGCRSLKKKGGSPEPSVEEIERAGETELARQPWGGYPLQNLWACHVRNKQHAGVNCCASCTRSSTCQASAPMMPGEGKDYLGVPMGRIGRELARQCVWLGALGTRPVSEGEDKLVQKESPPCLPLVQLLGSTEVGQVLMIYPDHERLGSPLQPVTPLLKCQDAAAPSSLCRSIDKHWLKKAHGCNFSSAVLRCESTALAPVSEVSTSMTNCWARSGCKRTGALPWGGRRHSGVGHFLDLGRFGWQLALHDDDAKKATVINARAGEIVESARWKQGRGGGRVPVAWRKPLQGCCRLLGLWRGRLLVKRGCRPVVQEDMRNIGSWNCTPLSMQWVCPLYTVNTPLFGKLH